MVDRKSGTRIQPYPLRIPKELKEWVKERARFNRRSLNTEFNVMIEIAKEAIEKKEKVTNG